MITKTINANGSKGHHKFTLRVSEDTTSGNSSFLGYSFTLSPIQTGWNWNWSGNPERISYSITIGTNTYSGTIGIYDGSSTVTLKSGSNIEIPHNSDGTKTIDISFKVTDTTGAAYTCGNASASGSMELSQLHQAPEITSVDLVENNTKLTNLSVDNNTIVQYLSNKTFTINANYDDATISNCSIYHNNVLIGTSTTNEVVVDFSKVSELITTETNGTHYVGLTIAVTDSKSGYSTRIFNFPVIKYTRPSIEATSTTIKRKTGNGTVLTDNIAILNFVGTCYKGDDVIGNANIPTVQYKIWNGTEPDYTTLTTPNTANITISDYQINNIIYTNVYNYKIKIYDIFVDTETITNYKSSKVPTGKSVFSEYKDRVDFLNITIEGKKVVANDDVGKTATAWLSKDFSFSANQAYKIPFDNFETDAEEYFELYDNGIKVLKECTVLSWLQWTTWGTYHRYAYIALSDGSQESYTLAQAGTVQTRLLLKCKPGDVIYGKCYAEGSNGMYSAKNQTNLQVTILK